MWVDATFTTKLPSYLDNTYPKSSSLAVVNNSRREFLWWSHLLGDPGLLYRG